ncbi:hypothetical protein KS4_11920 [Poriferisphaera corsica]|uniref:Uncharacterized protein n=1 Tax=Poriferisphaera corsica TaxID=2528020 RepID=A0A517YSD6_9BACT|nr:Minf_1886 family protein [Poriferisphaera corsica]QDU33147.1 hypothetical protein KS4_11920 [Poriferisphaera corsica]
MAAKDLLAIARESRYALDAFVFVQRGLEHTVREIHGALAAEEPDLSHEEIESRHVSGSDLCLGLRDYAIAEYGLMARTVLKHWYITSCEDFGNIVFEMIDAGLMHKTDEDCLEDFIDTFDFRDAFTPELQLS